MEFQGILCPEFRDVGVSRGGGVPRRATKWRVLTQNVGGEWEGAGRVGMRVSLLRKERTNLRVMGER